MTFHTQVYATRALGMQCSIVLPETVSPAKRQNLELAGASLTFYGTDGIESEIRAEELATVRDSDRYMIFFFFIDFFFVEFLYLD